LLISVISFSQNIETLNSFESIDSNKGARIHFVKDKAHKIEISGASNVSSFITWEVDDNNLKIRSNESNASYDDVNITIYTSLVQVWALSEGWRPLRWMIDSLYFKVLRYLPPREQL